MLLRGNPDREIYVFEVLLSIILMKRSGWNRVGVSTRNLGSSSTRKNLIDFNLLVQGKSKYENTFQYN